MKRSDLITIVLVAVLSLLPLPFLAGAPSAATVTVTQRGTVLYTGPLSTDAVVVTPDGGNTVVIESGHVRMTEASCPDRVCIEGGEATAAHPIVCLPNEVIVTVGRTSQEEAPDAVTQ